MLHLNRALVSPSWVGRVGKNRLESDEGLRYSMYLKIVTSTFDTTELCVCANEKNSLWSPHDVVGVISKV